MLAFQTPFVLDALLSHNYTVILLHDRGSGGEEFAKELNEAPKSLRPRLLSPARRLHCKFIFPHAHKRHSTGVGEMEAWFDIDSLEEPDTRPELQVEGLSESVQYLHSLIREERKTLAADRILLGGISQGFAVASHALMAFPEPLGGFVGISGWIPFGDKLKDPERLYTNILHLDFKEAPSRAVPMFLSHSRNDPVVNFHHGQVAYEALRSLGYDAQFHEYEDGEHWLQEPKGYNDLVAFFNAILV